MTERFTTRMAVFILMRNKEGKILLQQRANTGYLDGYYDFACSGHVDPDEDIRMCATRELKEEVGIIAKEADLRLVHIDHYFLDQNYVNFTFELDAWEGDPTIAEPEKCSDLDWFAVDELPKKCVNVLRVNEQAGFSQELTYSITNYKTYETIMGEPFRR